MTGGVVASQPHTAASTFCAVAVATTAAAAGTQGAASISAATAFSVRTPEFVPTSPPPQQLQQQSQTEMRYTDADDGEVAAATGSIRVGPQFVRLSVLSYHFVFLLLRVQRIVLILAVVSVCQSVGAMLPSDYTSGMYGYAVDPYAAAQLASYGSYVTLSVCLSVCLYSESL